MKKRLYDIAKVLRSKNSGPFEITLDVLFDNVKIYEYIKNSNIITKQLISELYNIQTDKIDGIYFYDAALGFKITFQREIPSGTCFDRDVYGAQQHAPLMGVTVDIPE